METIKIDRRMKRKINGIFDNAVACNCAISIEMDGGYNPGHGKELNKDQIAWLKEDFWKFDFTKVYHGWSANPATFCIYYHTNLSYDITVSDEYLAELQGKA